MFIGYDSRRLFRDMDVNQWNEAVKSPEIAAVGKALNAPQIQQRYHYAPFQEVNSAFLLGKLLSLRKEAYLVRSSQLSWEQMADTNWVFIGSPPFFGEVLAGIPVERQFVVEGKGVRNVHPKAGEPGYFLDSHTQGTYSPLGFSEDGEVYAVVTNAPGPAPNSDVRIFESNITSARLGAVQSFTDDALAASHYQEACGHFGHLAALLSSFASRKVQGFGASGIGIRAASGITGKNRNQQKIDSNCLAVRWTPMGYFDFFTASRWPRSFSFSSHA